MGLCGSSNKVYEASVGAALVHEKIKDIRTEYNLDAKPLYFKAPIKVARCRKKNTGQLFACKTYNVERVAGDKRRLLDAEVDALKVVDHPNICRLFETFEDRFDVHLVMSICELRCAAL